MTEKPDIQYISRFFVPGSDAPQVAPQYEGRQAKTRLPKTVPQKQVCIHMDPVAVCSVVVAVVLLVLMVVSVMQFEQACQEYQVMEEHLAVLRDINVIRNHDYQTSLDLKFVEEQALALGMVPVSEVKTIRVEVVIPPVEPEPTYWDDVVWFLEGLFA